MHEHTGAEVHAASDALRRKFLMWAFIGSDCMFFGSLIATYLVYRHRIVSGPTPEEILNIPFTSVSTFVLLTSSLAMVIALSNVQRGNPSGGRLWLIVTAALGLVFLGGQAYEFTSFYQEGLTLGRNVFGSSFFVLTGFHGTHVAIGVIWLISLVLTSYRLGLGRERAVDVEVAGLYWHFVDVVWIVIFTVVYLLSGL